MFVLDPFWPIWIDPPECLNVAAEAFVSQGAKGKRSDQGSDPKLKYRIHRKIPDPAYSLSELVSPPRSNVTLAQARQGRPGQFRHRRDSAGGPG